MDKVICVGKNYLKHARELGDAVPEQPVYFLKPPSTIHTVQKSGEVVTLPGTGEVHHEVELVFEISAGRLSRYTIGLDLTLRDIQARQKKSGLPWEIAKVFRNSCILGPWREIDDYHPLLEKKFSLSVNGEVRQSGMGKDMRWNPEFLLQDVQKWFPVCEGDLLFTGTPEGVGPLKDGDHVTVTGPEIHYEFSVARR